MVNKIIEKLDEADGELREEIKSAHSGMRNLEEVKCTNARNLIQKAISELLAVRVV